MVKEVHITPIDIGIKRFFTQGTVIGFLIIIAGWMIKTIGRAKILSQPHAYKYILMLLFLFAQKYALC
jgi:hypothetical protein